jgi:hypothetical protein
MTAPNLSSLFPGLSGGQGGVYMQQTGMAGTGALAGEADVMMISGLGQNVTAAGSPPPGVSVVGSPAIPQPTLSGQFQQPVTLGTLTLPLWQWLLIAALLGGAGGYYLGRR